MLIQPNRAQFVYVFFRHKKLITYTTLSVFALTLVYCLVATPKYQAGSSLVAEFSTLPSTVPSAGGSPQDSVSTPMDHEEMVNSYVDEMASSSVLRQVVSDLGPERLYPKHFSLNPLVYFPSFSSVSDPKLKQEALVDDAVQRLIKKDLKIEAERNANVINVLVKNPDRELAVEIVRRLDTAFLQLNAHISRNPQMDIISSQVGKYGKEVSTAQAEMGAFQKQNGISSLTEERTALIQQRALLDQAMMASTSQAIESHARYISLADELHTLSPVVTTTQNDRDPMALGARSNLSDLIAREARMKAEFGEHAASTVAIAQSISAARQLVFNAEHTPPLTHADPNPAYQQVQIAALQAKGDWDAAERGAETQRAQRQELTNRLQAINDVEGKYQDLVRNYQIADQNYRVYLQGVQEARVAEDLNKAQVSSISVFDSPYASPKPLRPGILVLALGTIGGFILGSLLAFLLESLSETFDRPEQVQEVLNLPVLGSFGAA